MIFSAHNACLEARGSGPLRSAAVPRSRRSAGSLVLLAWFAALLLGGCGAIRTVYNQAEHVLAWRADDYFDLTEEQKRLFHARFERLHAWHRGTQLQTYASLLESVDQRINRGPATSDVDWAAAEIRSRSHALLLHAQPDIAALLATLSDQQVANARRRFERDNRRFARERGVGAPVEEQRRLRAKRILEGLEHWTGPLDARQQERIAALSDALPLDAAFHQNDRLRRQREFLALLDLRREPERFAARLRDWLADWDASRPSEIDAEAKRYSDAYARMLTEIFAELRPDQRRRISERVRWYISAMRDLSRDTRS